MRVLGKFKKDYKFTESILNKKQSILNLLKKILEPNPKKRIESEAIFRDEDYLQWKRSLVNN